MQALGRMGEQVAVLVNRAALEGSGGPERGERLLQARRAVADEQVRGSQAARDEVVEQGAPGRLALAAHVADRQQHFLPVRPHAERDEKRN